MSTDANLEPLRRRAYQHTLQDGLTEIFAGVMLLAMAGILADPKFIAYLGVVIIFTPVTLTLIRNRFTYPRIGYVELTTEPPKRTLAGMAAFMGIAVIAMAGLLMLFGRATDPTAWRRWAPLMAAVLCGGGIHYAATRSGLKRIHVFQVFSLAVALVISLLGTGATYGGVQLYCLIMAAVALVAGVVNFMRFLRRYPIRAMEQDNRDQE